MRSSTDRIRVSSDVPGSRISRLNRVLSVAVAVALPLVLFLLIDELALGGRSPILLLYLLLYLIVTSLALMRPVHVRAAILGLLLYAAFSFAAASGLLRGAELAVGSSRWGYRAIGGLGLMLTLGGLAFLQRRLPVSRADGDRQDEPRPGWRDRPHARFEDSLINHVREGVIVENGEGRIVFSNVRAGELLGCPSEELLGQRWADFLLSEGDLGPGFTCEQDIDGRREAMVQARDGRRVPVLVSLSPVDASDGTIGALRVFIDIADRKQIEAELLRHKLNLESLVQERTAELAAANARLRREVTQRKRIEELLNQGEATFYAMLQHAFYGVVLVDQQERCNYINPEFTAITGYMLEEVPTLGDWLRKAYPDPVARREAVESWKGDTVGREGKVLTIHCKDEVIKRVDLRSTMLEDGRALLMLSDVTERERALAVLHEEWEMFLAVLQRTPYGALLANADDKCIYVTPRFTAITGYGKDDISTITEWFRRVCPDPVCLDDAVELWLGGTNQQSMRTWTMVRKDGKLRELEIRTSSLEDGSGRTLLLVLDVTRRRRIERAMYRQSQELALLSQAAQALTSTLDLDEVLAICLGEIKHLLGIVGASVWLSDPETGELYCRQASGPERDTVRDWRLKPGEGIAGHVAETGKSLIVSDIWEDERHYSKLDKETGLDLKSILTVPLRVRNQEIGVLQVVDSRRDRFDDGDRMLVESLAASAAIGIENARLYEQAKKDAKTKSILLREVNHRVKNILMSIVGLLYAELRHPKTDDTEVYQALMDDLINRVQGMSAVHSMLSYSEWAPVPLSDLSSRVLRSALRTLPPDKEVSFDIDSSPVRVTADQAHNLALVINELVTNAIKHGLKGRDALQIEVRSKTENGTTILEIWNDGPGYPEDVLSMECYSTGFDLAQNIMARNLHGKLKLRNDNGPVATITFDTEGLGEAR